MFRTRAWVWLLGMAAAGMIASSPTAAHGGEPRPQVIKTRRQLEAERATLQARRHQEAMNDGMNHEEARAVATIPDDAEIRNATEVARRHLAAMNDGMNHEDARATAAIRDEAEAREVARRAKRFRDAMNNGASREDAARAADEE